MKCHIPCMTISIAIVNFKDISHLYDIDEKLYFCTHKSLLCFFDWMAATDEGAARKIKKVIHLVDG